MGGEFAFLVRAEPDRRRGLIEQLVTENALDVDYAGRLAAPALRLGFRNLADRMVDDFVREADRGGG